MRSARLLVVTLAIFGAACAGEAASTGVDEPTPVSSSEICDGLDNDGDRAVDEGCVCKAGTTAPCYPGPPAAAGVGICTHGSHTCTGDAEFGGWGPCTGAVLPMAEICGNGIDEDCDGKDQPCQPDGGLAPAKSDGGLAKKPDSGKEAGPVKDCTPGQTRTCYTGPSGTLGKGPCKAGTQVCDSNGTWSSACAGEVLPKAEVCNNTIDEDCNGQAELCPGTVAVPINIDGDCVTATCPGNAPYPVGCKIDFQGGDPRGCVANVPNNSTVYFQEGNQCDAGHLTGVLYCSSNKGSGLNASNCPINKTQIFYPSSKSGCPPT